MFAELWIYMGLAWLSLFFSWNVNMVVEAHKVFKKRRQRNRHFYEEEPQCVKDKPNPDEKLTVIDIFNFPKEEDYSTIIKGIGAMQHKIEAKDNINRSKSCSDILATNIQTLDHSPRRRRMISISDVFLNQKAAIHKGEQKEERPLILEGNKESGPAECVRLDNDGKCDCLVADSKTDNIVFTVSTKHATEEESVQHPDGGDTRFTISKVEEDTLVTTKE